MAKSDFPQPIETVYNGYKFRSRLEARWAVFFDAIGWPYEYEPEGFQWHDRMYLPDFVCSLVEPTYFEIKPNFDDEEQRTDALGKWLDFAMHFVNPARAAVLVFGSPWVDQDAYIARWSFDKDMSEVLINAFISQCPCCKNPSILSVTGDREKNLIWNAPKFNRKPHNRARQARFEHGEIP